MILQPFSSIATVGTKNEFYWNIAKLMAETGNARSARFLTMPTVVEYCGVIHCGPFR